MKIMKHGIAVMLCCGVLMTSGVSHAEASTTQSQADQIAALQVIVLQLQAQLQSLLANQYGTYNPYNQYGTLPVASGMADVSVSTDGVSSNNSAVFNGTVWFNHDDEATVWFEYGPTTYLAYSTPSQDLRQSSGAKHFSMTGDAVRPGATTYYRAVATDSHGRTTYGNTLSFISNSTSYYYDNNYYSSNNSYYHHSSSFDEPTVDTDREENVSTNRADLNGQVDMNDADNGRVFFVYGEDERQVEDADREDSYSAIETDGDYLQKVTVDSSFDGRDDFTVTVSNLDRDTDIYYRLCVNYEDDNGDSALTCSNVEQFTTDY
jgi:hypothetical protein